MADDDLGNSPALSLEINGLPAFAEEKSKLLQSIAMAAALANGAETPNIGTVQQISPDTFSPVRIINEGVLVASFPVAAADSENQTIVSEVRIHPDGLTKISGPFTDAVARYLIDFTTRANKDGAKLALSVTPPDGMVDDICTKLRKAIITYAPRQIEKLVRAYAVLNQAHGLENTGTSLLKAEGNAAGEARVIADQIAEMLFAMRTENNRQGSAFFLAHGQPPITLNLPDNAAQTLFIDPKSPTAEESAPAINLLNNINEQLKDYPKLREAVQAAMPKPLLTHDDQPSKPVVNHKPDSLPPFTNPLTDPLTKLLVESVTAQTSAQTDVNNTSPPPTSGTGSGSTLDFSGVDNHPPLNIYPTVNQPDLEGPMGGHNSAPADFSATILPEGVTLGWQPPKDAHGAMPVYNLGTPYIPLGPKGVPYDEPVTPIVRPAAGSGPNRSSPNGQSGGQGPDGLADKTIIEISGAAAQKKEARLLRDRAGLLAFLNLLAMAHGAAPVKNKKEEFSHLHVNKGGGFIVAFNKGKGIVDYVALDEAGLVSHKGPVDLQTAQFMIAASVAVFGQHLTVNIQSGYRAQNSNTVQALHIAAETHVTSQALHALKNFQELQQHPEQIVSLRQTLAVLLGKTVNLQQIQAISPVLHGADGKPLEKPEIIVSSNGTASRFTDVVVGINMNNLKLIREFLETHPEILETLSPPPQAARQPQATRQTQAERPAPAA